MICGAADSIVRGTGGVEVRKRKSPKNSCDAF
jgi:hypothetical protein